MKGVIALCLKEMVEERFGEERWEEVLKNAGLPADTVFIAAQDVEDGVIMKAVGAACRVLGSTAEEAADAFGDYWINVYSQKYYPSFYAAHKTARDFILDMDRVHSTITRGIPNAHPPRFEFSWKDPDTLLVRYSSHRHMIDFAAGLIRGVGRYYGEKLSVKKISGTEIEVRFL